MTTSDPMVDSYHAHVYFSESENDRALALADRIEQTFGDEISRGRWHTRPVGPHPRGSCQISFSATLFHRIIQWLMLNRDGVTIFVHPCSGHDLLDHSEYALWLGPSESLRLSVFSRD